LIVPVRLLEEGLRVYVERQRPFQKFCGEYLFATRMRVILESESVGKMPRVEEGKCSEAAAAKDLWRDWMVEACWESRGCCWGSDAFCQLSEEVL
jgi:hypothetical protein